jgi:hypothetical protein
MYKSDAVGEGGVRNESMSGLGGGQVEVPEACGGCSSAKMEMRGWEARPGKM